MGVHVEINPSVYPVGETNLSIKCGRRHYALEGENMNLKLQIRSNSNDNWTSVSKLNGAGVFSKNKSASFEGLTIFSLNLRFIFGIPIITLEGSVEPKQCTVDPQESPSVRCVLSNGSQIIHSFERRIFSIKGGCSFGLSYFMYFAEYK